MTTVAAPTVEPSPRQMKRRHEAVAALLSVMESKAADARDLLLPLYDENAATFELMDEEEREAFNAACNGLHDLITATQHLAHHRRMAASRALWTQREWSEYALVALNID